MSYKEIKQHLLSLADQDIADHSRRFFKTAAGEYGFGDRFLGIRVPAIRQTVKRYADTHLDVTTRLLKSEYHEIRLFALLLLVAQFSKADKNRRKKIYDIYLANTRHINNWDLVDSSAHKIVGVYLENNDRSVLYKLSRSDSLWERRIAIIATYHYIREDQFEDTLRISEQLLDDQEDLIHKAVGWMLREVGKRDKPAEIAFLNKHYRAMPRTMLRYAIERFSNEERQNYLRGLL
ncbi:MAG: DNA alkylation repair protein [Gammaproteobacteria bacterium]|nr:DNA alkylation repair protein [Gammaproteobacteria bacterium]MBT8134846.1 DNA alkylation repair protein [Gammaproteobacteria bacterium]NNJ49029.1 DNA alkylation repair protein [Gammaproteobacteria bacterium]